MTTSSAENSASSLELRYNKKPDSRCFSRIADEYRKKGDVDRAIEICMKGLQTHPDYITGRIILGRCRLEQEDFDKAIQEFTNVCNIDRRNHVAIKMLADIFARRGFEEKAGDLYAVLLKMDPFNKSIVQLCSQYKKSGNSDIFNIIGIPLLEKVAVPQSQPSNQDLDEFKTREMPVIDEDSPNEITAPDQTENIQEQETFTPYNELETISSDSIENFNKGDIGSRMSMMFGENNETETENTETPTEKIDLPVSDDTLEILPENLSSNNTEISGLDISSRIDELFGKEADDSKSNENQIVGSNPELDAIELEAALSDEKPEAPQSNSSADFNTEFEETIKFDKSIIDNALKGSSSPDQLQTKSYSFGSENLKDDLISEDIESPLSQKTSTSPTEVGQSDLVVDAGEAVSNQADNLVSDESDSESIFKQPELIADFDSEKPVTDMDVLAADMTGIERISGDDVAQKLDQLFKSSEDSDNSNETHSDTTIIPAVEPELVVPEIADANEIAGFKSEVAPGSDLTNDIDDAPSLENDVLIDTPAAELESTDNTEPDACLHTKFEDKETDVDGPPAFSGTDIAQRLEDLFHDDNLMPASRNTLVPEDEEEEDLQSVSQGDFYNVSGETVSDSSADDMLDELNNVGNNESVGSDTNPQTSPMEKQAPSDTPVNSANVELMHDDPFLNESIADEELSFTNNSESTNIAEIDERDKPYSIPDHVLTPTLADIYFQQGQPDLAIQIYSRLVEQEPDNQKLRNRLEQIKSANDQDLLLNELPQSPDIQKNDIQEEISNIPKTVRKKKKAVLDNRPLAGVRIKKSKKK